MLLPAGVPDAALMAGEGADAEVAALLRGARIASVRAHRNVLFGARSFAYGNSGSGSSAGLVRLCRPLVRAALDDAWSQGEQPQAVAELGGLCAFVARCLDLGGEGSAALTEAMRRREAGGAGSEEAGIMLGAVRAIATGVPRPGQRVLGAGTYATGRPLWEGVAREYAMGAGGTDGAAEAALYRAAGGEVVGVDHLADTSEPYLRTAGGAMARIIFA